MGTQHRRKFLQQFLSGSAMLSAYPWLQAFTKDFSDLALEEDVDEGYWKKVRKQYTPSKKLVNLNNAGVNPQTKMVQEAVAYYEKLSNEMPSYYMWRVIEKEKGLVKNALADLLGVKGEDLALMRNASEALETVVFGLPLKKGDEVVLSKHDYPHVKFAWRQRERRDKIKLKWVSLDLPSTDRDYLVKQYDEQISEQTKLVCITHITNWNGQVLPVKQIAEAAKAKGAEVMVDAAHTVAQRPLDISAWPIDYLGSSLHKWLGAPFGTGMLYVHPDKRSKLYPMMAGPNPKAKHMHKFEHSGTKSVALERAILPALVFHNSIGTERKMNRLQFLKTYIVDRIKDLPGVIIQSPTDNVFGSAILLIKIQGREAADLVKLLEFDWQIHCTISENESLSGIRISPNIYTLLSELDTFVAAIKSLTKI